MKTHKMCVLLTSVLLLHSIFFMQSSVAATGGPTVQRDVLPPPPPAFKGKIGKNYKEAFDSPPPLWILEAQQSQ